MVRHISLEIAYHGLQCLVVERKMVRVDAINLRPSFAAGILQGQLDIGKSLVNLRIKIAAVFAGGRVPSSCRVK